MIRLSVKPNHLKKPKPLHPGYILSRESLQRISVHPCLQCAGLESVCLSKCLDVLGIVTERVLDGQGRERFSQCNPWSPSKNGWEEAELLASPEKTVKYAYVGILVGFPALLRKLVILHLEKRGNKINLEDRCLSLHRIIRRCLVPNFYIRVTSSLQYPA